LQSKDELAQFPNMTLNHRSVIIQTYNQIHFVFSTLTLKMAFILIRSLRFVSQKSIYDIKNLIKLLLMLATTSHFQIDAEIIIAPLIKCLSHFPLAYWRGSEHFQIKTMILRGSEISYLNIF